MKLKLCFASISCALLISCGGAPVPDYQISSDDELRRIKRTVDVAITTRFTEGELAVVAENILDSNSTSFDRTFISYYLSDYPDRVWATSHADPEVEVKIQGMSEESFNKVKQAKKPDGEVLGSWMVFYGFEYRFTPYIENGQVMIEEMYDSGINTAGPYHKEITDKGIKLSMENSFGEFYLLTNDGAAEFWSENGRYYVAK